jgi:hypothetical protein
MHTIKLQIIPIHTYTHKHVCVQDSDTHFIVSIQYPELVPNTPFPALIKQFIYIYIYIYIYPSNCFRIGHIHTYTEHTYIPTIVIYSYTHINTYIHTSWSSKSR